ncbi:sugar ABC transporter permease [Cohnella sp. CIP 111063]|jgi:ABC-type sugar transport system, permease component|uniref:carbohydrate ABC transporter permease n=1 Tax=unclassified Cohnella TaxID=2636738 RepID=UPI000B8C4121|nr:MULTISPECIES: carbohydrate ABC transporter permease [unclassified Cohnella]OXS55585.1 sugar ABC transporter permease [Cohnella sp. CIP 111063]PRX66429.1 putative aldouronate transport system permease protein [Cohnella sp. SGD-V74]
MRTTTWKDRLFSTFNYTLLSLLGFATLYPFVNLMAISLNDALDSLRGGIYFWPRKFTLLNYEIIFEQDSLLRAAIMSVVRTAVGTVLGVAVTIMIAFALSRREFLLRKPLNVILVFTLFVNAGLLPAYLLNVNLNLMNSFAVYILPMLVSAYNVIIVRSYFEQLPEGLTESAKIDGATDFQVLLRIVAPVSLPVLATVTLFVAVVHWNSWYDNYLYTSGTPSLNLLQFELMKILINTVNEVANSSGSSSNSNALNTNPDAIRAAMTIIVTLPILFVYPFLQKYFVKGIMVASMKE